MRNKFLYTCFTFMLCVRLLAQDAQFTQFYASPIYLNPAFTGLTYEHRFTGTFRQQWPSLQSGFKSYMASYDYNMAASNSGIGFLAYQDVAGISRLVTTQFGFNYSYRAKIDRSSEVRGGISLALGQEKIDNSNLLFNDQLATGSAVSLDAVTSPKVMYPDLGAGALYNGKDFWAGIGVKHINRPNVSLTGSKGLKPVYLNIHGGYRYVFPTNGPGRKQTEEYASFCFNYRHQGSADQLDIGGYYFINMVNVGVWYRGLPLKKYKSGYSNNESVALLLGCEIPDSDLRVGYSYDFTVSSMKLSSTKGAHEVTLIYEIAKKHKRNARTLVSSPKF